MVPQMSTDPLTGGNSLSIHCSNDDYKAYSVFKQQIRILHYTFPDPTGPTTANNLLHYAIMIYTVAKQLAKF